MSVFSANITVIVSCAVIAKNKAYQMRTNIDNRVDISSIICVAPSVANICSKNLCVRLKKNIKQKHLHTLSV